MKRKPQKELIIVIATLLLMWLFYYLDRHNCPYAWFPALTVVLMIGFCVGFPAYWIAIHNKEGFSGLMITTKKLLPALGIGILLAVWRGFELIPQLHNDNLLNTVLFNMLCIWEACFIYCWMYTRYERSFGKIAACILTALSVGLYHVGSLPAKNILYLMLCILICAICISFTHNIFTVWPLYWLVGCSASTLAGGMTFPFEAVILAAAVLVIQLICLAVIYIVCRKKGYR